MMQSFGDLHDSPVLPSIDTAGQTKVGAFLSNVQHHSFDYFRCEVSAKTVQTYFLSEAPYRLRAQFCSDFPLMDTRYGFMPAIGIN